MLALMASVVLLLLPIVIVVVVPRVVGVFT
jgi:hypothetical protein